MKYLTILVVLVCLALPSTGAAKSCKIKENKLGYYETKPTQIGRSFSTGLFISFLLGDEGLLLQSTYYTDFKSSEISVDAETPITFWLDGGQEISLAPLSEDEARRTFVGFIWNSKKLTPIYPMSRDNLHQLANASIVAVSISTRHKGELKTTKYDVKERLAKKALEIAECVLNSKELTHVSG